MSSKGRIWKSRRDPTFSEIQRRVAWDTVGLLSGQSAGRVSPSFVPGRPTFSYPLARIWVMGFLVPFGSDTIDTLRLESRPVPGKGDLKADRPAWRDRSWVNL